MNDSTTLNVPHDVSATPLPSLVERSARLGPYQAGDLIAPDGSSVDRRLFVDPELYELEQEKIFAKCWLYLGHESALPSNGSFFTTTMGEDSVIVVRDK